MTQVEEAFTDTTMEKPAGFLDFVRKQIRQLEPQASSGETVVVAGPAWGVSHREPVVSAETLVTTGRSGFAVTTEAVASGTWLPQSCFVMQQEGGEGVFLFVSPGYAITSSFKREHPIVLELYEMFKDDHDNEIVPKKKSIAHAINFARNILEKTRTNPVLDLHPDGEISMTWRKASSGILNIAFGEDGIATYAAYLLLSKETRKGRFRVSSIIPDNIIDIIDQIEKL